MILRFILLTFIFVVAGLAQEPQNEVDEVDEGELAIQDRKGREKKESIATSTSRAATEFELAEKLKDSSVFDKQLQDLMQKTLADAKLWEQSKETVKKMVEEGSKGKYSEKVFKTFPKLLDLSVNMLQDKEAMPQLIKIFGKKQLLKQYGLMWLIMMVGLWLVKKQIPPEPNFMRQAFTSLCFSLFASACSIGLFYLFFHDEITPTATILVRTFWTKGA